MSKDLPTRGRFYSEGRPDGIGLLNSALEEIDESDNSPRRAVAATMFDELLDGFLKKYSVEKRSQGRTCLRRLHGEQCKQYKRWEECEPHTIPHTDHTDLWLRDGEPVLYTAHLYDLPGEYAKDIVEFCEEHGLDVTFDPLSYYNFGSTTLVAVSTKEEAGLGDFL